MGSKFYSSICQFCNYKELMHYDLGVLFSSVSSCVWLWWDGNAKKYDAGWSEVNRIGGQHYHSNKIRIQATNIMFISAVVDWMKVTVRDGVWYELQVISSDKISQLRRSSSVEEHHSKSRNVFEKIDITTAKKSSTFILLHCNSGFNQVQFS